MRIKYTHKDINNCYEKMFSFAWHCLESHDIEKSLKIIDVAANLQYHYNSIFKDDRLNGLLRAISECVLDNCDIKCDENCVLFYDFASMDNRGLTQQYIHALLQNPRRRILYVTEKDLSLSLSSNIKSMLDAGNVSIYELVGDNYTKKVQDFYSIVVENKPSCIFMHIAPWSVVPLTTLYAIKGIRIYNINITDHAFWLGNDLLTKSIEFRTYGIKLSLTEREINKNQICFLPFYPWVRRTAFKGFPTSVENKIVIFSGGSIYKITDEADTFFHMVRYILIDNPQTIFFYAGTGNTDRLIKLINKYQLCNRFFLLGDRTDIAEVFDNCHIYLGTYPVSGELMSQYAAFFKKPIVALLKKGHDIIVGKNEMVISYNDINELYKEMNLLINDSDYREEKGKCLKDALITQAEFSFIVNEICKGNDKGLTYSLTNESVDFRKFKEDCLERLNLDVTKGALERRITKVLGIKLLFVSLKITVNSIMSILMSRRVLYK